ncbi:hypothetical protein [Mesorhizobium sp. B2-4-17]|uniref:hypothetical protein n=1 Tax=Mesorhizobium sp. B2-4-17 TaxID=2589932 RepID=UPI00112B97EB|nr:hypothetical protein [Mesorhizobium sp. B2-4-17]TPK87353.1 hypothetical protein FJ548_14230 [Mesorhizobium sp. B2-4-17]
MFRIYRFAFIFATVAEPAFAQQTPVVPNVGQLGIELVSLAVVVLVVESALATIFQWRLYRMLFNNRAMKTVVMVAVGLTVVLGFHYDIFARLIVLVTPNTSLETWSGKVSTSLSSLIIAGGSAGVNTLLQRLGIRNPVQAEPERPVLNNDQAWISIRVKRNTAVGPVQIALRELADDAQAPALAGTVVERSFWETAKEAFMADAMRFPSYGGRTVTAGKTYEIVAIGTRQVPIDGVSQKEEFSQTVYKGSFAPRAIIDFSATL